MKPFLVYRRPSSPQMRLQQKTIITFEQPQPQPQPQAQENIFGTGYHDKDHGDSGIYMSDGQSRIDMVIAYEEDHDNYMARKNQDIRQVFERNLRKAGLVMERQDHEDSFDKRTSFLKIHCPESVLQRNAAIIGLKPPVKQFVVTFYASSGQLTEKLKNKASRWASFVHSFFESNIIPLEPNIFHPGLMPDRSDKFVMKERMDDLSTTQRIQIVWQILTRTRYDEDAPEKTGIQRLMNKHVYKAAFPLHDGDYEYLSEEDNAAKMNDRRLLYLEWANLRKWNKKQPLWLIKDYFGAKIGLYFAWLGFYTQMLIIPSIVGLLCFIFGCATVSTSLNEASQEICSVNISGDPLMCPVCDHYCDYWTLSKSCLVSKITYLFDNSSIVFFAIFMSLWATTYLELWKRRQAILIWEWDLSESMDDAIRPEYEAKVKTFRYNPVSQTKEPFMSTKEKTIRISLSYSFVIFMLVLVVAVVFSVIIFRLVVIAFMYQQTDKISSFSSYARILATTMAAIINSVLIELSGFGFQFIARKLTNLEYPRTQSEYESSYTFKMFLFQFINYYSSLVYTAFFKGRFYTYPGDPASRDSWISRLKMDQCDPAGCLFEVCTMLALYMIIRQIGSNCLELFWPKFKNWYRRTSLKLHMKVAAAAEPSHSKLRRWEKDYQLEELDRLHLFDEYIEMIIQYGFVTLFVAAFPLAPLLALINNVFEIRLDAYKYTTQYQRPVASPAKNIGIWYPILEGMTYLAVGFNAFIIALTSDFIPKMVYTLYYSDSYSLTGYVNFTLAAFDTSAWQKDEDNFGPRISLFDNVTQCSYRAFRAAPGQVDEYKLDKKWLHVFAARLAFVVIFEQIILVLKAFLSYVIPETPLNLQTQLAREHELHQDLLYRGDERSEIDPDLAERSSQCTLEDSVSIGDLKVYPTPSRLTDRRVSVASNLRRKSVASFTR